MKKYRTDAYYELRTNDEGSTCFTRINADGTRMLEWEDGILDTYKKLIKLNWDGYRIEVIDE